MIAFRAYKAAGVVALFDEAPGGGDPLDIDAPRNRPAKTPADWLPNIYFHSSLDGMEAILSGDVLVNHPFIDMPPGSGFSNYVVWSGVEEDHILYEHNLGYPPLALVAVGSNIIWPGMLIHVDGAVNFWRYGTIYSNDTHVRLFVKTAALNGQDAPAVAATYKVLVFKDQAGAGNKLLEVDAGGGVTKMGFGKFNSSSRYLQVVPGGTPLGFAQGRTLDLNDGCVRAFRPDGTFYEAEGGGQFTITPGTGGLGGPVQYAGSYAGPPTIQVQAP